MEEARAVQGQEKQEQLWAGSFRRQKRPWCVWNKRTFCGKARKALWDAMGLRPVQPGP